VVLQVCCLWTIIALVFHRILDFKTGLNFYSDPFFIAFNQAKNAVGHRWPTDGPPTMANAI
jgi:hypothetical protein